MVALFLTLPSMVVVSQMEIYPCVDLLPQSRTMGECDPKTMSAFSRAWGNAIQLRPFLMSLHSPVLPCLWQLRIFEYRNLSLDFPIELPAADAPRLWL